MDTKFFSEQPAVQLFLNCLGRRRVQVLQNIQMQYVGEYEAGLVVIAPHVIPVEAGWIIGAEPVGDMKGKSKRALGHHNLPTRPRNFLAPGQDSETRLHTGRVFAGVRSGDGRASGHKHFCINRPATDEQLPFRGLTAPYSQKARAKFACMFLSTSSMFSNLDGSADSPHETSLATRM